MDAWTIMGYTYNGEVYCPDCGEDVYAGMPENEEASVIFASDEFPADWTCMSCDVVLSDPYGSMTPINNTKETL